ncbi:ERF family protein [Peptoniphilus grossensis]|uniref:ERF family protein n=1 Tax=Peptoniphilus grossensis TaxID=1465756 RepID=UPI0002FC129A|nr:ERF family protein [Peptoniphilus grossensis]
MDNTIFQKLQNIQSKLKVEKKNYNSFGGYNYRSCEDILEAVKPLLVENNLALVMTDEVEAIGERYYIKATATLYDTENGTNISATAYAREVKEKKKMDDAQVTGSSSSYARKYALNGLFAIDDAKDSDFLNKDEAYTANQQTRQNTQQGQQGRQSNQQRSNPSNILESTRKEISQMLKVKHIQNKDFINWLKKNFNTDKLDGLQVNQLNAIKSQVASW